MTEAVRAAGLFGLPAPRVVSIPAPLGFLDVLADTLVATLDPARSPFALADALILLPTRRAANGLMDAFAARLGGAALLPAMRPLADVEDDPDVWGAEPMAFAVPPAIAPMQRRLELAALIRARDVASGGVDEPLRALAFADELCALLDGAAAAGEVDWTCLPDLIADDRLAAHWRQSAEFLKIITEYWPQRLAADGLADPGARRSSVLRALAQQWQAAPPTTPIIIAGSTGSLPATRALMQVVAALPMGVVVLPGLDTALDEAAWAGIAPQHPQATLKETLGALGLDRRAVHTLGPDLDESGRARLVLLREALAPADATADWLRRVEGAGGSALLERGARGLSLVEAETEIDEASVIALALRAAMQEQGKTAALVTPSAVLARRVAVKLARWGERVALSLGRPLGDTPIGHLLLALLALASDDGCPISLAAVLKHPLVPGAEDKVIAAFEYEHLRGARRHRGLSDLMDTPKGAPVLQGLGRAIAAFPPVSGLPDADLCGWAEALCQCVEDLAGFEVWAGSDGSAAAALLRDAIAFGSALQPMSGAQAIRTLRRIIERTEVPPAVAGEARIVILGPLEARLQRRDFVVLGGLNEGVWPEPPPEGAFLSRSMRTALGLASPDQRVGLAAHDFAQLASAPQVLLTRAKRENGAPSVASRWIWRLQTLLKVGGEGRLLDPPADRPLVSWARQIDRPVKITPVGAPLPQLPPGKGFKALSVTDVDTLIRDPYALYAKRVLGLRALKGLGARAGAAERGTGIHAAIEAFEGLPLAERTAARLEALLQMHLTAVGFRSGQLQADGARLRAAARAYADWSAAQQAAGARTIIERPGRLRLSNGVMLNCLADRIDLFGIGPAQIVDVKSGTPPSVDQLKASFSPQLLLEAAILAGGGFDDVPPTDVEALVYWHFSGSKPEAKVMEFKDGSVSEHVARSLTKLEETLAAYNEAGHPLRHKPRVFFVKPWTDYDHLARRKEWAAEEAE